MKRQRLFFLFIYLFFIFIFCLKKKRKEKEKKHTLKCHLLISLPSMLSVNR